MFTESKPAQTHLICESDDCYVSMQVAMRTFYFTWINTALIALSIVCWFPALWGFSRIGPLQRTLTDMVELGPHLFSTPAFWLAVVVLAPVMALLLDFALSAAARQAAPLDRQIFQVQLAWQIMLQPGQCMCRKVTCSLSFALLCVGTGTDAKSGRCVNKS